MAVKVVNGSMLRPFVTRRDGSNGVGAREANVSLFLWEYVDFGISSGRREGDG
jgi:hypothetical protein